MNLRRHARNKPCQVRIPGVCCHDVEQTSLAHLRMAGITGTGMKAPDILGAWACTPCAKATESGYAEDIETKLAFFEGMARTQDRLIAEGLIKW